MAKYEIKIENGVGTASIPNGIYSVESNTAGYLNTSVQPKQIEITASTDTYKFTLDAIATLKLHVTENGSSEGPAIVGAKFVRCDINGNIYGDEVTTDASGNAIFENLPFDSSIKAPIIYYKQILSDEFHQFDSSLQITVLESTYNVIEVTNPLPDEKTFNLSEEKYSDLPVAIGYITLTRI